MLVYLLVGEAVIAIHSLKTGVTQCLSRLDARKESLERSIQSGENILQDLRIDLAVLWANLFDGGQLGASLCDSATHAALLPRHFALAQGGVVEFTAAQDKRHRLLLLWCRREFVLVRLAHRPGCSFIGLYSA
jgi:hypothetical protein